MTIEASTLYTSGYDSYEGLTGADMLSWLETGIPPSASLLYAPRPNWATVTTRTWVPPTPALPAVPSTMRTAIIRDRVAGAGWASGARSIEQVNGYVQFTVDANSRGAAIFLGPKGVDGQNMALFSHGIVVDIHGTYIFERGAVIEVLRPTNDPLTLVRIYLTPGPAIGLGTVTYTLTTGLETIVRKSQTVYPFWDCYAYGLLYQSSDLITSAANKAGEVQYGSL
jgi:hypothetical protein